jgi:hypothetical protein
VLLAIDGLWRHASQKVWCGHCRHITKDGETTYYHSAAAGATAGPGHAGNTGGSEADRNGDGEKKQDCGWNEGKRHLLKHEKEYAWLSPTLLDGEEKTAER